MTPWTHGPLPSAALDQATRLLGQAPAEEAAIRQAAWVARCVGRGDAAPLTPDALPALAAHCAMITSNAAPWSFTAGNPPTTCGSCSKAESNSRSGPGAAAPSCTCCDPAMWTATSRFCSSRTRQPSFDHRLLAQRMFGGGNAALGLLLFAMTAASFYGAFYLQGARGFSPLEAGVAFPWRRSARSWGHPSASVWLAAGRYARYRDGAGHGGTGHGFPHVLRAAYPARLERLAHAADDARSSTPCTSARSGPC